MKANQKALSGRYELTDRLGSGGMAEVFLGKDRVLGRTVAVKTLLPQFAGDPHFIARFRREAQSAAALNHPHIVGVYDTGSDGGTHYIVMEYIEGKTLRDVIREEGPLLPERAAEIAGDVCAALAFAHTHGIVHRDVKPANIMLNKGGEVKVTDFGIARAASSETVTQTATVLGTAQYFSPEQAQAGSVDARSDIYSLGIVLYEMLTRQVPFTGSSPVAIAYKHVKEDPVLPSRLNADIPPALEAIVMKALAKNPDNRYQTAQEMRQDLARAASGKPVHATPLLPAADQTSIGLPAATDATVMIPRTRVPPEQARRRRTLGWILLTLIMLGIGGIVAWAIFSSFNKPVAKVRVPDVRNLLVTDAHNRLTELGLRWTDNFQPNDTVPENTVFDVSPPPETQVDKDSVVQLFISGGRRTVTMPNLIGKTQPDATKALEDLGLQLGNVTRRPSKPEEKDKVVQQSVPPNTQIRSGQKIDVVIGTGPETAPVPSVVGQTEASATANLQAQGFIVSVVHKPFSPDCFQAPGRVCRQDPEAGQVREKGTTVTITVVAPGQSSSPSPSPSD